MHLVRVLRGGQHHRVVDEELLGHLHIRELAELPRVGYHAVDCRGHRRLRADEVNLAVLGAAPALEVPVEGP